MKEQTLTLPPNNKDQSRADASLTRIEPKLRDEKNFTRELMPSIPTILLQHEHDAQILKTGLERQLIKEFEIRIFHGSWDNDVPAHKAPGRKSAAWGIARTNAG